MAGGGKGESLGLEAEGRFSSKGMKTEFQQKKKRKKFFFKSS